MSKSRYKFKCQKFVKIQISKNRLKFKFQKVVKNLNVKKSLENHKMSKSLPDQSCYHQSRDFV